MGPYSISNWSEFLGSFCPPQFRLDVRIRGFQIGTEGSEAANGAARQVAENKNKTLQIMNTPIPAEHAKSIIDKAIRRKWKNAPHCKHTELFYNGPDKNRAKHILNLSRSHLTKLISIIMGFNCLSYIHFKADPTINPLYRLCGEENETFWHLVTVCPRLKAYRVWVV